MECSVLHRREAFLKVNFYNYSKNKPPALPHCPKLNVQQSELFFCLALYLLVLKTTQQVILDKKLSSLMHCPPYQDSNTDSGPGFTTLFLQIKETTKFELKGRGQEIKEDYLYMLTRSLQSFIGIAGLAL